MNILTAHQVKEKMAQNPETKLIMVLGAKAYNKAHIPGSLDMSDIETVKRTFSKNTEIIVHCSDVTCPASFKGTWAIGASWLQKHISPYGRVTGMGRVGF